MKKRIKALALVAAITLISQSVTAIGSSSRTLSPNQVVQASKENDIQQQIDDMEHNLKNLRAAYRPSGSGLGGGPWAVTYTVSIAPLLTEAQQKAEDYQTANGHWNSEYTYYDNAYTYWLLSQTARYKTESLSLAQHERDMLNIKFEQGLASKNELLQAEISVNTAQNELDKANMALQMKKYQINQSMNSTIDAPLDITDVNLDFLSPDELNLDQTLNAVHETHKSLEPLNTLLAANEKARSIAAGQTDINVPVKDLVDYYVKEIEEVQLKIKQQRQRLEIATRSYLEQLKTLENSIKTAKSTVEKTKQVYDNQIKLYEVGMITYNELETARMNLVGIKLQLASNQKDYLALKEKYRLFKEGAFITGNNSAS